MTRINCVVALVQSHLAYYITVMNTTGAICISEVLGKCSLQVLATAGNEIGDDGITAIAGALSNSQINELNVETCGITLTGAVTCSRIASQQQ